MNPESPAPPASDSILTPGDWDRLERDNILRALEEAKWRIAGPGGAAELLQLKPSTLTSRMKKLGLGKH
jgi:transcriptional regulator with GAF, ATPase, and Fis domain